MGSDDRERVSDERHDLLLHLEATDPDCAASLSKVWGAGNLTKHLPFYAVTARRLRQRAESVPAGLGIVAVMWPDVVELMRPYIKPEVLETQPAPNATGRPMGSTDRRAYRREWSRVNRKRKSPKP